RLQEIMLQKLGKKIGPEYRDLDEWNELVKKDAEVKKAIEEMQKVESEDPEGLLQDGLEPEKTDLEGKGEGGAENEEPQLNEVEQSIRDYLEMSEPQALAQSALEVVIPDFWTKEPYQSTGFALEGFPKTENEMRWLAEVGLYPDIVVFLATNSN